MSRIPSRARRGARFSLAHVVIFALVLPVALSSQDFSYVDASIDPIIDPQKVESLEDAKLCSALFEGLTIPDPKTGVALPGLAESWTFSQDFRTVTLRLRRATWSDGTPITAKTVADSWLRKMNPANGLPRAELLAQAIEGGLGYLAGKTGTDPVRIKVLDERSLEVGLAYPMPYFAQALVHPAFAVVPMHVVATRGEAWADPASAVFSGPFRIKAWEPGSSIILEPNPLYWDAASVGLKGLSFVRNRDPDVGFALYKSGGADWLDRLAPDQLKEASKRKDFFASPGYGLYYYLFNATKPPLDDPRVRRALGMAVDKSALAKLFPGQAFFPADSFVPPSEGYSPALAPAYDPAAAKALLAEAGYPEGAGMPALRFVYNSSSVNARVAQAIKAQWKAVLGVELEIVPVDWPSYLEARSGGKGFDVARAAWMADYQDPSAFMDLFRRGSARTDSGYANPELDALLAKADAAEGQARFDLIAAAEAVLLGDAALLPLYFYGGFDLIDTERWDGWHPNPLDFHPWKFIKPKQR
ncbi:MAG TPA: peptide ABC transporter substrate-binding protein [Rectinemataceae bacterium]